MPMKASEVGDWLRQTAGKPDHRAVMSGGHLVLRPGPNFHLLNPVPAPPIASGEIEAFDPDQGINAFSSFVFGHSDLLSA